jgi:tetratricopeptide (TPR) repeat protein
MLKQEWSEAAAIGEKLLARQNQLYDEHHPAMLGTMENLGQVYKSMGRVEEALAMGKMAMELRELSVGSKHSGSIAAKAAYAVSLCEAGRAAEAQKLVAECLLDGEDTLGADHPSLVEYRQVLAHVHCHQGQLAEALKWQQQAVDGAVRVHGDQHPMTTSYREKLAWIRDSLGRSNSSSVKAGGIDPKSPPEVEAVPISTATQQLVHNMQVRVGQAEVLSSMQQFGEAGVVYKELLADARLMTVVDSPEGVALQLNATVLAMKTNYAICLFKTNKFEAVTSVLADLLLRLEAVEPPPPIEGMTMCRQMLEQSYAMLKKPELTLQSMTDNWKYTTLRFGEASEQAITVINGRAMYHFALRNYAAAKEDFTEVMRLLVLLQGAGHADTIGSLEQTTALFATVGVQFSFQL